MLKKLMLGLCLLMTGHVNATTLTYQTLGIGSPFNPNGSFLDYWNLQLDANVQPTTVEYDVFEQVRSGNNTLSRLSFDFDLTSSSTFSLNAGLDAGHGAEVYVNGFLVFSDYSDLWWSYNWSNSDVVNVEDIVLAPGNNEVDILWAEGCCNGYNTITFAFDDMVPEVLGPDALDNIIGNTPVSAPSTLLMSLGALALMVFTRRRQS